MPGLISTGIRYLLVFSDMLLDGTSFFKILLTHFSLLTAKLKSALRVNSKEYKNLNNMIIVYAKLNWI